MPADVIPMHMGRRGRYRKRGQRGYDGADIRNAKSCINQKRAAVTEEKVAVRLLRMLIFTDDKGVGVCRLHRKPCVIAHAASSDSLVSSSIIFYYARTVKPSF